MAKFTSHLSGSLLFKENGVLQAGITPGVDQLSFTGSVHISGSKLLLNGLDIGQTVSNIDSGYVASGSLDSLNIASQSLEIFSGSAKSRLASLEAASGSYLTASSEIDFLLISNKSADIVSSSMQISALGFVSKSTAGTISSSAQILDLGFVTGSHFDQIVGKPTLISSSNQLASDISGSSTELSASLAATISSISTDFADITNKPTLISSSIQIGTEISGSFTNTSASLASDITRLESKGFITGSSLDMKGNRVLFGNIYLNEGDLPNAADYHGMFAHVHNTGKAYYAHDGNWEVLHNSGSAATIKVSSGSQDFDLNKLTVNDYDDNVGVVYNSTDKNLTLTFGTPAEPSSFSFFLSGYESDRFNAVTDSYNVSSTWNNGGFTLDSAKIYEASTGTVLASTTTGTSLTFAASTTGNHTYELQYTGSSPLDASLFNTTRTTSGTLSKSNPASPSLTPTVDVQLGASSNQIEQGATGSISFTTSAADPSNQWDLDRTETNFLSPYGITGSATGSSSISLTLTAYYDSPAGDNSPDLDDETATTSRTYTKIRSVRRGASTTTAFTAEELTDLQEWNGNIGTIDKGNTNPSGDSITITWTGDKFHYIVYDGSRSDLSNITTNGFGVLGQFTKTTVGDYTVYKSNTLQAGGTGTSITYILT